MRVLATGKCITLWNRRFFNWVWTWLHLRRKKCNIHIHEKEDEMHAAVSAHCNFQYFALFAPHCCEKTFYSSFRILLIGHQPSIAMTISLHVCLAVVIKKKPATMLVGNTRNIAIQFAAFLWGKGNELLVKLSISIAQYIDPKYKNKSQQR